MRQCQLGEEVTGDTNVGIRGELWLEAAMSSERCTLCSRRKHNF